MDQNKKRNVVIPLAVVCALLAAGFVSSCFSAAKIKADLNQEKVARFEFEEKLNTLTRETASSTEKIQALADALEEEQKAHESTKQILNQQQLVNQSLQEELRKLTVIKEALEQDLRLLKEPRRSSDSKK